MKSSSKILFLTSSHCAVVLVLSVRYCIDPTLKPGQTEEWHLESEPGSAWLVLHPLGLEHRWEHEAALWTFLASSSMAVDGPQVPYFNWFESCALQRYCLQNIIPCYASAHGFWQSDFKRSGANFECNISRVWFLCLLPIPKPCSYCCLVSAERKYMEINAEVKTSESHHDPTIIPEHTLLWELSFCVGCLDSRARRRTWVNRAWVFAAELFSLGTNTDAGRWLRPLDFQFK